MWASSLAWCDEIIEVDLIRWPVMAFLCKEVFCNALLLKGLFYNFSSVPLPTCDIGLTRSTAHTLDFAWCPPEGTLWDSFDVTYSPSDGSLSQVDPTELTVELIGLDAAKEYTLSVVTVSGNQRSEPRTLSAFTGL